MVEHLAEIAAVPHPPQRGFNCAGLLADLRFPHYN